MNDIMTFTCECGWIGTKDNMYYRNDSGYGWWCDQHECPKCFEVMIDSYGEIVAPPKDRA